MPRTTLAISHKALTLPLRRSLPVAAKLGVKGLEIDATGELAPAQLSQTARRELRHLFRSNLLEVAAVACPLRHWLDVAENHEARIDYLRQSMTLCYELGARVVVVQPGALCTDEKDARFARQVDALVTLGQHGDRVGAQLVLETGPDAPEALLAFLDRFDTAGLGVAFNPGNVLVYGHDPYAAVRTLRARLSYVHATDARRAGVGRLAQRLVAGHGDLDWLQLLANLEEIEYRGWLTVDCDPGPSAQTQLAAGIRFLQNLVR